MHIGEFFREMRTKNGWTIEEVSEMLEVKQEKSTAHLSRIERGQHSSGKPIKPSKELAVALLELYGCLEKEN